MKRLFLVILLLSVIFVPFLAKAALVPQTCGQSGEITYDENGNCTSGSTCPCGICHFFQMLANIYDFIVKDIATPLAVIALTIGGIMMMISAGNPNLMGLGKKILFTAIIGLVLVWCSWLIIDFILTTLGMSSGSWANLNLNCEQQSNSSSQGIFGGGQSGGSGSSGSWGNGGASGGW